MKKCKCYEECTKEIEYSDYQMGMLFALGITPQSRKFTKSYSVCNGTSERDECHCGGDRTKCDFYPEVREKALHNHDIYFSDWIESSDKLPDRDGEYLVYYNQHGIFIGEYRSKYKLWIVESENIDCADNKIVCWQPLPQPPKENN